MPPREILHGPCLAAAGSGNVMAMARVQPPAPPARRLATPLRVLMVASEATPFSKTGGLADVASALPRALGRLATR